MDDPVLLIATRNRAKLHEIREILNPFGMRLLAADDFQGPLPEVEEDGETFAANASKKALMLAAASGCWTLADDSGLDVDALAGAPGVYSARYAGEPCDDAANNRKLLEALNGVIHRQARYRCAIALASPDGRCGVVEGACEGRIAQAESGTNGFGYDSLFIPAGHTRTFGILDTEQKHRLSHRGTALRAAVRAWRQPDGTLRLPPPVAGGTRITARGTHGGGL